MSVINGKVEVLFYNDDSETEFPEVKLPQIAREFKNTSASEIQIVSISLAASGSQSITLNGLDAVTGLYFYSGSTDINVNINALGNIQMKAQRPSYLPATITSLTISNVSSTTATTVELALIKE